MPISGCRTVVTFTRRGPSQLRGSACQLHGQTKMITKTHAAR